MSKVLFQLLFIILCINLSFSQQKIYFIGHAYGSHVLNDDKIDESAMNFFKNNNSFIDLNTGKKYSPTKFLRWKVRLYQTPKLFLYFLKKNFLIIILITVLGFFIKILKA